MKHYITALAISLLLIGCVPSNAEIQDKIDAWSVLPVQVVGDNLFFIEGDETRQVIKGGQAYCSKVNGKFAMSELIPQSEFSNATLTFKC